MLHIEEPQCWKGLEIIYSNHFLCRLINRWSENEEFCLKSDITVARAEPRVHSTANSLEALWKPPVLGMMQVLIKCLWNKYQTVVIQVDQTSWFAGDSPGFSTECPASWEIPQKTRLGLFGHQRYDLIFSHS